MSIMNGIAGVSARDRRGRFWPFSDTAASDAATAIRGKTDMPILRVVSGAA